MTLRGDSYGSVAEVAALTRHMLDGETTFNSTTVPTGTEVEKFIDRISASVNIALQGVGLSSPITTNSTAVLDVDNFVVSQTARYVELTMLGAGSRDTGEAETMGRFLAGLNKSTEDFVKKHRLGWARSSVTVSHPISDGLVFTGETLQADRVDPDNSGLEQPKFKRGQFDA